MKAHISWVTIGGFTLFSAVHEYIHVQDIYFKDYLHFRKLNCFWPQSHFLFHFINNSQSQFKHRNLQKLVAPGPAFLKWHESHHWRNISKWKPPLRVTPKTYTIRKEVILIFPQMLISILNECKVWVLYPSQHDSEIKPIHYRQIYLNRHTCPAKTC